MKAIVYEKYGSFSNLKIKDVGKPVIKDEEVLIKVCAVSINHADLELLKGNPLIRLFGYGLLKPKHNILGSDVSGVVEAVGRNVRAFKPGDEVFGDLSACGSGGLAEYVRADQKYIAIKPGNISHTVAAAVPLAAVTALQGLKKGKIQAGQKVLINGASGGVGFYALQLAKAFDTQVTAVCSTRNLEKARKAGADSVIDYTKTDFTAQNIKYDLILGVNGYHPMKDYKKALSDHGTYIMIGGTGRQIKEAMLYASFFSEKNGRKLGSLGMAKPNAEDLKFIAGLMEKGKIVPSVDKIYPLKDTAEAFRYMIKEHAMGKVVIEVSGDMNSK
jgi:NADPH:quinone reductase-like Zn-dependent oxidoreductase